jgi:hypothetical protein
LCFERAARAWPSRSGEHLSTQRTSRPSQEAFFVRANIFVALLVLLVCFSQAGVARAIFVAGNLVIYRVSTNVGQQTLSDDGNQVFLDEYTPAGVLVQSIALPSTGGGVKLVADGTDVTEGLLTRSPDGRFLALTGYNSTIGGGTPLVNTSVDRSVAIVDQFENVSLFGFNNLPDRPRSAVLNGTNLYVTGSNTGTRFVDSSTLTAGTTGNTTTQINSTPGNLSQVNVFGGQLYVSTTATNEVGAVGTGVPTTSGQSVTSLPGLSASDNPFAFFFADLSAGVTGLDTLYVASDNAAALTKYSLVGGVWTSNGTVGVNTDDYRGLTGSVSGSTVTLYATRKSSELVSLVDASGYNGAFAGAPTLLAMAATNTAFRGVAFAPVPEPGAVLFGGVVCAALGLTAAWRRVARRMAIQIICS